MAFLAEAKARKGFKRVFDIDSQEPEISIFCHIES